MSITKKDLIKALLEDDKLDSEVKVVVRTKDSGGLQENFDIADQCQGFDGDPTFYIELDD